MSVPALITEAGGDPWAINESLQAGRPAQIAGLADTFHTAGRCTAEAGDSFDQARRRFDAAWNHQNGDHPINSSEEVARVTKSLGAQSLQLPKVGVGLEKVAAGLAEAQRNAAGEITYLEGRLRQLDDLIGQAVELHKDPDLAAEARSELDALITACEDDAVDDTRDSLNRLRSVRNGYSDCLQKSLAALRSDGYDAVALRGLDAPESPAEPDQPAKVPLNGTSAQDVHRWWTSLAPEQQQSLIAVHPDQIGNLNGVPVSARNDANEAVLTRDLNRVLDVANRNGVKPDDVVGDPAKYGLSATDLTRYQNADETKQGLEHDAGDPHHPNPVYLFAYDPVAIGGKGRAAIAIGNPDTAKNTAVIVPGTGSSVKGGWLHDNHNDALNLYAQANAADPNTPTAVMAWMGYDAPNDFSDIQRISTPALAGAGSEALVQDVNGLGVTHVGPGRHVTVIGHSYGSTTVADAFALHHMNATDAVLLGCPGTDMARNASSFHLDGGQVYVGDASTDPVGMLGQLDGLSKYVFGDDIGGQVLGNDPGLGADPAAKGFGAIRFRAEVPGSDGIDAHDHSYYYHQGSEALYSMADIVSGHGGSLAGDGMLAGLRHQPGIPFSIPGLGSGHLGIPGTPASVDPEWNRSPGSVTHDHVFDAEHHH